MLSEKDRGLAECDKKTCYPSCSLSVNATIAWDAPLWDEFRTGKKATRPVRRAPQQQAGADLTDFPVARMLFDKYAKDGDDFISYEGFRSVLDELKVKYGDNFQKLARRADANKNGKISKPEVLHIMGGPPPGEVHTKKKKTRKKKKKKQKKKSSTEPKQEL